MIISNLDIIIANLRHLYAQMVSGEVKNTKEAAEGLLGPCIKSLEEIDKLVRSDNDE